MKPDNSNYYVKVDYCYGLVSKEWSSIAMGEEMETMNGNDAFALTRLPEGKKAVGGRNWKRKKKCSFCFGVMN